MVAACPFPANHGSAASIREMSDTLTDMGHNVHIVTYPFGQDDIRVRRAKVHRTASFRPEGECQGGSFSGQVYARFPTPPFTLRCDPRGTDQISFTLITTKVPSSGSWPSG